uniref:Bm581 n=1 Tax=Brugia malayi TaxID=6279 RepID=A0A1I9G3K3_BRUMA|nr:Bm581 [Brugia malayi]
MTWSSFVLHSSKFPEHIKFWSIKRKKKEGKNKEIISVIRY